MKDVLKNFLVFIIFVAILYGIIVLFTLELNPLKWNLIAKLIFVGMIILAEYKHENDKK